MSVNTIVQIAGDGKDMEKNQKKWSGIVTEAKKTLKLDDMTYAYLIDNENAIIDKLEKDHQIKSPLEVHIGYDGNGSLTSTGFIWTPGGKQGEQYVGRVTGVEKPK